LHTGVNKLPYMNMSYPLSYLP